MKVLLVNGSPNKEGNTHLALSEVANTLREEGIEAEIFWIGNKALSGCIACRKCATLGTCVFQDTVNEFAQLTKEADGFIFGTPVHYGSASGGLISFMDRLFYSDLLGGNHNFYMKPAAAITVARRAGTTASFDQLNKYFTISQMPIVSSRYWNNVHGGSAGQVNEDEEGMQTMRILARNMAFLLKCKELALQHGLKLPEQEETVFTNFIR